MSTRLTDGRTFDYDIKSLLGESQPPFVPVSAEMTLAITGLDTYGQTWNGLGDGIHDLDGHEMLRPYSTGWFRTINAHIWWYGTKDDWLLLYENIDPDYDYLAYLISYNFPSLTTLERPMEYNTNNVYIGNYQAEAKMHIKTNYGTGGDQYNYTYTYVYWSGGAPYTSASIRDTYTIGSFWTGTYLGYPARTKQMYLNGPAAYIDVTWSKNSGWSRGMMN